MNLNYKMQRGSLRLFTTFVGTLLVKKDLKLYLILRNWHWRRISIERLPATFRPSGPNENASLILPPNVNSTSRRVGASFFVRHSNRTCLYKSLLFTMFEQSKDVTVLIGMNVRGAHDAFDTRRHKGRETRRNVFSHRLVWLWLTPSKTSQEETITK